MLQVVYLLHVRPFENELIQRLEIFNELCSICLIYALMCFTGANQISRGEIRGETLYDFLFFAIIAINLLVHLSLLMKASFISLKAKLKAKCCRNKGQKSAQKKSQSQYLIKN